jgi:hypothetical protein
MTYIFSLFSLCRINITQLFVLSFILGIWLLNIKVMNNGETISGKFYANDGTIKDQFTITKSIDSSNSKNDNIGR